MQPTVSRELWLENAMAQYETPLLRLCCALLGDAALAEDAVQGLAKETDCIFLMRRQIQDIAVQLSRLEGYVPPSED